MAFVATLLSNPSNPALTQELVNQQAKELDARSITVLADNIAADLQLSSLPNDETLTDIRTRLSAQNKVDIIIQQESNRRKKLLIADMDSTMIGQECIDELAAEVGLKDQVSAITARAMNGEIEFEPALRERVALLKDLAVSVIDDVIRSRITLTPGGHELLATMRANGAYTALVSGGFTAFTSRVAAMLGFDENRANILIEKDGKLTGAVGQPILGQQAKVDALNEMTQSLGISAADAIAVGDGANDLGMLRLAGSGVALHAKPAVAAQTNMRVDHGDLTALLYIQGYRQSDFSPT